MATIEKSSGYVGNVFVPFLGDFFSITASGNIVKFDGIVFVPFLGDFFSMGETV